MSEPSRPPASRHESGRTEVIRVEGGCVVATEMVGDDGVPWIAFTRLDDDGWAEGSEEGRPLP
jgi:hypothetical protein